MLPPGVLRAHLLPQIAPESMAHLMACNKRLHEDLNADASFEVVLGSEFWHVQRPVGDARQAFFARWSAEQQFHRIRRLAKQHREQLASCRAAWDEAMFRTRWRVTTMSFLLAGALTVLQFYLITDAGYHWCALSLMMMLQHVLLLSAVLHCAGPPQLGFSAACECCSCRVKLWNICIYRRSQWCGLRLFMENFSKCSFFCTKGCLILILALGLSSYFPLTCSLLARFEASILLRNAVLRKVEPRIWSFVLKNLLRLQAIIK